MSKNYPRWQAQCVKKALKTRRVVIISGARQTGKTTLAQQVSDKNTDYRTLDDTDLFALAMEDPKGFIKNVKNSSKTMIIDEIQKAPKLIPEIKMVVDRDNRNGQYLLTGSANIQTMPSVTESLAGRVKNIRLRPLSVGETLEAKPTFLKRAFEKNFPTKISGCDKQEIVNLAFRGGYPEAIRIKNPAERKEWYKDYIKTLIEHDLRDIANIRRQGALQELLGILASWSAKFMDLAAIGSSLSLTKPTLESYINWLVSLYLFEKVSPWIRTDYDRVGKKAKLYAADTGIMTSILGWEPKETMLNHDRSGKLVETFVFQELAAQVDINGEYSLYQYRDREKREIDFIVEREDGALLGVEVKAGHSVSSEDFEPQKWFAANIVKNKKPYISIVLYSGERVLSFGENLLAVPISALWTE
ncbi:MAG: ATP-binding protein [Synergistaceae bacterium]|jgi:predicted AAA+ superfamily ATPase|nr:ATP-binding protein [Synergistaceae bacterium]